MTILLTFAIALVFSLFATRLVRQLAPRIGLVDSPDGVRKLQRVAIPVGGGLAVLFAMMASISIALSLDYRVALAFTERLPQWLALGVAAAIIVIVGLIDDCVALRPINKLMGQLLAITVLVFFGNLQIVDITVFGTNLHLGWTAIPITYFWFLAAVNSLNLLDGMDGLLGTVGGIICGALACIGILTGQPAAVIVAVALAGALAGFLRFNLPPATIYLGDSGSMLIGLMIGGIAIQASMKSHAAALLAPSALLVLPFLDTFAAIVRRKLSGRSMSHADREHLHHVLLRRWSVRFALFFVASLGGIAALGATLAVYFRHDSIAIVTSFGIVVVLLAFGWFGGTELKLIRERFAKLITRPRVVNPVITTEERPVQATP